MDNIGLTWETEHGKFELNLDTVKWIMDNASHRCIIVLEHLFITKL